MPAKKTGRQQVKRAVRTRGDRTETRTAIAKALRSVETGDVAEADLLGADRLAFAVVGAVAEPLGVHLLLHPQDAPLAFGLALRKDREMGHLRADEKHRRGVRARGDAGAAADAGGGVHCLGLPALSCSS